MEQDYIKELCNVVPDGNELYSVYLIVTGYSYWIDQYGKCFIMEKNRVGTIKMSGDEARNFFITLFCPTQDKILEHKAIRKRIDENISITKTENGFIAENLNNHIFKPGSYGIGVYPIKTVAFIRTYLLCNM